MEVALAAAALLTFALVAIFIGVNKLTSTDPELLTRLDTVTTVSQQAGNNVKLSQRMASQLGGVATRSKRGSRLAAQLERANLSVTVGEFLLFRLGLMAAALAVGWLTSGSLLVGLLVALVAGFLPGWYLNHLHKKRQQLFQSQLPDVLTLIVSSLQAGHGLVQAIKLVTEEMPPPSSEEFERVIKEITLGIPVQEALQHLVERIESDDLDLVVTAINIQHEVGGNLAAILTAITDTIRDRVRVQGEIRVMTTTPRATGFILSGMPFVLGLLLMMINPEYMMGLFNRQFICLPVAAVVMIVLGQIVMRKMLDFEY